MNWGIIIIIDVAVEYVYFCKLGPKEYIEGEAVKMYIRLNFFLSPKFFFLVSPKLKVSTIISLMESVFMVHSVHNWHIWSQNIFENNNKKFKITLNNSMSSFKMNKKTFEVGFCDFVKPI